MGLDFSHCDAHWAYSGFMRFRIRLAAEIGITLLDMKGFNPDMQKVSHGHSWDKIKDDIVPLLNHSDCEGELSPEECRKVASRLRELVVDWPEDDFDRGRALELAEGMESATEENEPLIFC